MIDETEKLEFKSIATNEIYKEVIAFANTDGGILLIGIGDDGKASELLNVKRSRASSIVRIMIQKGLLKITGRGKNKKITLW